MSEVVRILWQSAAILIGICVILFFMPIAIALLRAFISSLIRK